VEPETFEALVLADVALKQPGLKRSQACAWLAEQLDVTGAAVQHWFAGRRDVSSALLVALGGILDWDDARRGAAARLAAQTSRSAETAAEVA